MHIFIDESGPFLPLSGARARVSALGALVLRSKTAPELFEEFGYLSRRLTKEGQEVKGAKLREAEMTKVLKLLGRYDAILESAVIDMGHVANRDIQAFKELQAGHVTKNIPATYSEGQIQFLHGIRDQLLDLPNQLFMQVMMLTLVVEQALETSTMYYSQRRPEELGDFHWVIDAKDKVRIAAERLWTWLVLPFIDSRSRIDPMKMADWGDYSHYATFDAPSSWSNLIPDHLKEDPQFAGGSDIRKVLSDLTFRDSAAEEGLRLVDIALSALTRAQNDKLGKEGWKELGHLLVLRRPQSVNYILLSTTPAPARVEPRHSRVIRELEATAKSMIRLPPKKRKRGK